MKYERRGTYWENLIRSCNQVYVHQIYFTCENVLESNFTIYVFYLILNVIPVRTSTRQTYSKQCLLLVKNNEKLIILI